eukprot:364891-Chlamydomonas_euryale.AAC.5
MQERKSCTWGEYRYVCAHARARACNGPVSMVACAHTGTCREPMHTGTAAPRHANTDTCGEPMHTGMTAQH